ARQDVAPGIDDVAAAVEPTDVPGRLRPDPIDGADKASVGDRGGRLLQLPEILAEPGDRRRRVDDIVRPAQGKGTPAFGEVTVVAGIDPKATEGGVEYRIAQISGLEEELLIEAGDLRNVDLPELSEIPAVRVDHGDGVVVDPCY